MALDIAKHTDDARYGVYLPRARGRAVDFGESTQPDAVDAYAFEVLVTDRERIRSIRIRTRHAGDAEDALLLRPA